MAFRRALEVASGGRCMAGRHVLMVLSKPVRQDGRVRREARALAQAGLRVTVIQWDRHEPDAPRSEVLDGMRVLRVRAGLGMPAPAAMPFWWAAAARAGSRLHADDPVSVVHCHDLDTLPAGVRLRHRHGLRLVFDAHERYPDLVRYSLGHVAGQVSAAFESRHLRFVDLLVTVNEPLASHYRALAPCPVVTVANCPDLGPTLAAPPASLPFTAAYAGTLDASRLFPDLVPVFAREPGVRLVVAGRREAAYDAVAAASQGQANVRFLGEIPPDEVVALYASSNAVLCPLDPAHPMYRIASATKVFEAMAAGRPVVTTAGTLTASFVRDNDVGLVVPFSPEGLLEGVRRLARDPALAERLGRNGRRLAEAEYHWGGQARHLVEAYAALPASRSRG